jgi:PAS domain-containing protein
MTSSPHPGKLKAGDEVRAIDWTALARKLDKIQAAMLHGERSDLHGSAFTAESLRRLLDGAGSGFIPLDEHARVLEMNRSVDRASGEQAQKTLEHLRAEYERRMADSARVYSEAIRVRAEREIASRYRREGALLAAGWLAPDHTPEEGGNR